MPVSRGVPGVGLVVKLALLVAVKLALLLVKVALLLALPGSEAYRCMPAEAYET
jgi:hypothetical protein